MAGYACRITPANFQAIASEKPDFDLEEVKEWLEAHGEGYFLRDASSVFDCKYIEPSVLLELYIFADVDPSQIFQRVVRI